MNGGSGDVHGEHDVWKIKILHFYVHVEINVRFNSISVNRGCGISPPVGFEP